LPPPKKGLPTWLLTIIFTVVFVGLGALGIRWLTHSSHDSSQAAAAPIVNVPANASAHESAMQKYVEVSGIRFVENAKKQTEARFVVVNHSGAEISNLAGTVNLVARVDKQQTPAGEFTFSVPSLGPYESKDMTAPVNTTLKVYELPDWQFVSTQVQVTSP
jgi:hypothetical protein